MPKQITAEVVMRKAGQYGTRGVKDTEGKWWDFPDDKVNFGQGAVVSIESATGPKKNRVGKFTVVSKGQVEGGRQGGTFSYGGKAGPSGDYSEVNWNASVARATEIVDLLLRHDAIALGAKTAKPAERQTIILDVLDEITARVYTDIKERRPLKKAKELAEDLGEDDPAMLKSAHLDDLDDGDFSDSDDL